mmetsp:Transcript_4252/g.8604  ORF Transcript_4252/g.8604 Transcript_4252/m.8604 type:complete len:225 (-) Transcript_4252:200-874(-)|eukprot:CAMPEP_0118638394 /NCGR_PEP_ID=MMETSP0785-20121206/3658_1 /TAXON_ID=91992 /ORGANISM="Bolidomonas pacifica, Strain CCMP 1866" /LENGTH=224 /DNA_ID=CAMNT_0006529635 /DNA_START=37 /DNA_END=711 /DNA_ORIENTATION=-
MSSLVGVNDDNRLELALQVDIMQCDPTQHHATAFHQVIINQIGRGAVWNQEKRKAWLTSRNVVNLSGVTAGKLSRMIFCLSGQGDGPHDLSNSIFDEHREDDESTSKTLNKNALYDMYESAMFDKYGGQYPQGVTLIKKSAWIRMPKDVCFKIVTELQEGQHIDDWGNLTVQQFKRYAEKPQFGTNAQQRNATRLEVIMQKYIDQRETGAINADGTFCTDMVPY